MDSSPHKHKIKELFCNEQQLFITSDHRLHLFLFCNMGACDGFNIHSLMHGAFLILLFEFSLVQGSEAHGFQEFCAFQYRRLATQATPIAKSVSFSCRACEPTSKRKLCGCAWNKCVPMLVPRMVRCSAPVLWHSLEFVLFLVVFLFVAGGIGL